MADPVTCPHCDVEIARDEPGAVAFTRFPDDPPNSYALLALGLGHVVCPACHDLAAVPCHHLVVDGDGCLVLGLRPERDDAEETAAQWSHEAAEGTLRGARLVVARGAQEFRSALVRELVGPRALLLNQFVTARGSFEWVGDHLDALDRRFFQAMALAGTGVLPLFTQLAEPGEGVPSGVSGYMPDAAAPDAARHVVRRREAEQVQQRTLGLLLGDVLMHEAQRCMAMRSLSPLLESLPARLTPMVLDGLTLDAAVERLVAVTGNIRNAGGKGAVVAAYLFEASLALACHAMQRPNPRRNEWTAAYLHYDLNRRLDGNDESVLPAPELVRATVDAPSFWSAYRELGRVARAGDNASLQRKRIMALIEAVVRIFPDEVTKQTQFEIRIDPALDDRQAAEELKRLFDDALQPPGNPVLLEGAIAGIARTHPAVVQRYLEALVSGNTLGGDVERLGLLRLGIHHLHLLNCVPFADRLVRQGLDVLCQTGDNSDTRDARGQFLNEVGNSLRLHGKPAQAQACYEHALELLDGDGDTENHRVAKSNLAIVLREQHRYVQAAALFEQLMPQANASERRTLVTSLALCLSEMGQGGQALALLEAHVSHFDGVGPAQSGFLEFATLLAFLRGQAGRAQEALKLMDGLRAEAKARRYHAALLVANDLALRIGADAQVADAQLALLTSMQGKPLRTVGLLALQGLDAALGEAGRHDEAEELVRGLAAALDPALEPRGWLLHRLAARHAERRGASPAPALARALLAFQRGIATAAAGGDVREFALPQSAEVRDLVAAVLALPSDGALDAPRLWRHAADMTAAPVLTSRLRQAAGLPSAFEDAEIEDARLHALLSAGDALLVQAVAAGATVRMLCSRASAGGKVQTQMLDTGLAVVEAERIGRSLAFHLLRADAQAPALHLARLRGWPALAEALGRALPPLPEAQRLLVVAGPVSEAAWNLALGRRHALSFLPSVAAATALRGRPADPAHDLPKRVFGFATWLDREGAEEAAALGQVAGHLASFARHHGAEVEHVQGRDASRERLLAGLQAADLAWIACHGRLRRDAETVELLVAAGGRLPPARIDPAPATAGDSHAVGWQALSSLTRVAPVVISSACDSGLTLTNGGGERMGLERALLPAGARTFIAPLWPVPTVAVQQVVVRLLASWQQEPALGWSVHLRRVRDTSARDGLPALAFEALAVFGDVPV